MVESDKKANILRSHLLSSSLCIAIINQYFKGACVSRVGGLVTNSRVCLISTDGANAHTCRNMLLIVLNNPYLPIFFYMFV